MGRSATQAVGLGIQTAGRLEGRTREAGKTWGCGWSGKRGRKGEEVSLNLLTWFIWIWICPESFHTSNGLSAVWHDRLWHLITDSEAKVNWSGLNKNSMIHEGSMTFLSFHLCGWINNYDSQIHSASQCVAVNCSFHKWLWQVSHQALKPPWS